MTGALANQVVFVAGGAGLVGSGIVRDLLQHGAVVWTASRSEESLNKLRNSLDENLRGNLHTLTANVTKEQECVSVRDQILKNGTLNHVISSLGSWWDKGKLTDQSVEEFHTIVNDFALSHFVVFKTFANYLSTQPKSTYTFITGAAAEHCWDSSTSLSTVGASCLIGVIQAALAEFKDNQNLRINEVRYGVWIQNKLDSEVDQSSQVGKDWAARFVSKAILGNGGYIRIYGRQEGDELIKNL